MNHRTVASTSNVALNGKRWGQPRRQTVNVNPTACRHERLDVDLELDLDLDLDLDPTLDFDGNGDV
jgi:hypothetical protein